MERSVQRNAELTLLDDLAVLLTTDHEKHPSSYAVVRRHNARFVSNDHGGDERLGGTRVVVKFRRDIDN